MTSDPRDTAIEELRRELSASRRYAEEIQAQLYEFQVAPPGPASGEDLSYRQLVRRVREAVRAELPPGATVLVMSKGDRNLVDIFGRPAWHFPCDEEGKYAGYYPKRDLSAIAHLEALRARGADYVLFPSTALWWFDHYPEFARHLRRRYRLVVDREGTCVAFSLREPPPAEARPLRDLEELVDELAETTGEEPTILDWDTGLDVAAALPGRLVFSPPEPTELLPYLDDSIDVVVTATDEPLRRSEASRVASLAVVGVAGTTAGTHSAHVLWRHKTAARLPSVSIVIPCYDGVELTSACLATLRETLPVTFEGEILIVDDASRDGTAELVRRVARKDPRIRVLRNRKNLGFLGSCNRGGETAEGDYVLFLNNDTVLLPGWLPPLLRTFSDFPDAGVVGGRLLYPDGRLQEAGCLVFADGSAAKFGYRDPDPDAPGYRYAREVDYVSGALFATPRAIFRELGGFDGRYGFGYYDDDDYCFGVRELGHRVYYQPESVVVHVEGGTAGTDLSVGLKQHQVLNQEVFREKWSEALAFQPARPDPLDSRAQLRLAARGCWDGVSS